MAESIRYYMEIDKSTFDVINHVLDEYSKDNVESWDAKARVMNNFNALDFTDFVSTIKIVR